MASLSGEFNTQEFTDDGAPLVGGRVYTYVNGTTTQKNAYTDIAEAVPHTYTSDGMGGQYIALNARGELPAPLYLASGAYDIVLKRADGSTVWTRRADGTAGATDLAASSGAGLVGIGLATVSEEIEPSGNQQGASPNALTSNVITGTDNATIFNTLLALPVNNVRASRSYDPASATNGGYLLGSTVSVPWSMGIKGEGIGTRFVVKPNTIPGATTVFRLNSDGTTWPYPFPGILSSKFSDMFITASQAVANGDTVTGIEFAGSQHIHDVKAGDIQTIAKQLHLYSDLVKIERLDLYSQPAVSDYAIKLDWTGDGVDVNQISTSRTYDSGNPSAATRFRAILFKFKVGSTISNILNGDVAIKSSDGIDINSLHMEDGLVSLTDSSGTVRNANFWMRGDTAGELSITPLSVNFAGAASQAPGIVSWSDIGFIYQQAFPEGYTLTKPNFSVQSGWHGHLRINSMVRRIRSDTSGNAAMGQKYGVNCGNADFDNYSHLASIASEYRNTRWHIAGELGDLPLTDDVISTGDSGTSPDAVFNGTTTTYYYKAQILYDKIRMVGLTGAAEKSIAATSGGDSPVIVLTSGARVTAMFRIYRGTSSGSYDKYIDIPLIAGARFADTGNDIGGYPWIARGAGAVDAVNAGSCISYHIEPGNTSIVSTAYGKVKVRARSNAVQPTTGTWRTGDEFMLAAPESDGFNAVAGWKRLTDGSGHVNGVDWYKVFDVIKPHAASSGEFLDIGGATNTLNKFTGKMIYDVTTSKPLWALSSAAGGVWKDATGTTIYTPV